MPPAHDLEEVRRLAGLGSPHARPFKDNALDMVADALDVDLVAAEAHILKLVGRLTPGCYVETLTAKAPPADVYGLAEVGHGWYIKVAIDRGKLLVISCHAPSRPLHTRSGETITYRGY